MNAMSQRLRENDRYHNRNDESLVASPLTKSNGECSVAITDKPFPFTQPSPEVLVGKENISSHSNGTFDRPVETEQPISTQLPDVGGPSQECPHVEVRRSSEEKARISNSHLRTQ